MAISARVARIIHEVEALDDHERDELLGALAWTDDVGFSVQRHEEFQSRVQDMEAVGVPLVPQEEVNAEWSLEIHRRAREIDDGKVQLVEEEEFFRKLRAF